MIAFADTPDRLETYSRIGDADARPETHGLRICDWLLPELAVDVPSTTEPSKVASPSPSTRTRDASQYTPAIRRSSLDVKFSGYRVKVLQQWEGVVISINEDYVSCELHDLTDEANPIEYAELYLSEFCEFDRPLLSEGAVFYWSVGHVRRPNGQVTRTSDIRVRRMPKLSRSQRDEISRKVKEISDLIVDHLRRLPSLQTCLNRSENEGKRLPVLICMRRTQ